MSLAPSDPSIQFKEMMLNPYPVYRRLRHEAPVMFAPALNRTLITKAVDARTVKGNPVLFSSYDPTTPMERAFEAHTLMRKDGEAHLRERNAMMPTFAPKYIKNHTTSSPPSVVSSLQSSVVEEVGGRGGSL